MWETVHKYKQKLAPDSSQGTFAVVHLHRCVHDVAGPLHSTVRPLLIYARGGPRGGKKNGFLVLTHAGVSPRCQQTHRADSADLMGKKGGGLLQEENLLYNI